MLDARLAALSRAHDILTREHWAGTDLGTVVRNAIEPFAAGEPDSRRFRVEGPVVRLSPKEALSLSLGLHELATNAAKYGALSIPKGDVSIRWSIGNGTVRFVWEERNGPPVVSPRRQGFGSRLITRALAYDMGGTVDLDYDPGGVRFHLTLHERDTDNDTRQFSGSPRPRDRG